MRKFALIGMALLLLAGSSACGKYGKPVRDSDKKPATAAPAPTTPEGASLGGGDELTEEIVQ